MALTSHPFWHTVFYSLQFGPRWDSKSATHSGLPGNETRHNPVPAIDDIAKTGDEMVYSGVKEYILRHHLPYQTEPDLWYVTPQSGLTTPEAMPLSSGMTMKRCHVF